MMSSNLKDKCFYAANKLIQSGMVDGVEKGLDVDKLAELLFALETEREYKNSKSDSLIDYNDEIVEIEEIGELETIDITVSGDNLFYCNDILTKNSAGIPAIVDLYWGLIFTDELKELNQCLIKQLKNRYKDLNYMEKFVIGVSRPYMRLYDLEKYAQTSLVSTANTEFSYSDTFESTTKRVFDSFKM